MSAAVRFNNPTSINRMPGGNWVRFFIKPPPGSASGFFAASDMGTRSSLPPQLKQIGDELAKMDSVHTFHFNIGGEQQDRISVKFRPDIDVDDGLLRVVADIIGEPLG
jgi:hypothetical protein